MTQLHASCCWMLQLQQDEKLQMRSAVLGMLMLLLHQMLSLHSASCSLSCMLLMLHAYDSVLGRS